MTGSWDCYLDLSTLPLVYSASLVLLFVEGMRQTFNLTVPENISVFSEGKYKQQKLRDMLTCCQVHRKLLETKQTKKKNNLKPKTVICNT